MYNADDNALNMNKYKCIEINIILQTSPVVKRLATKNGIPGKSVRTGTKLKLQMIKKQDYWNNIMDDYEEIIHYKLSYYISKYIIRNNFLIGKFHYYYNYDIKQARDKNNSNISYAYINHNKNKCIPSIKDYYNHDKVSHKDHADLFNWFCQKSGFKYTQSLYNIYHCHKFWIGISMHTNIISVKWKEKMFKKIDSWKKHGPPNGIWKDPSRNREKYFINYKYCYRSSNKLSTNDVNKANSIAAGLRNIKNAFIPKWINELISYLKNNVEFISKNECINQLGINYYYNDTENKIVYNGIDPHLEYKKFSVVYSVSIYKNALKPTSLSFNLHSNKSCGDSKILMLDCSGMKMHS